MALLDDIAHIADQIDGIANRFNERMDSMMRSARVWVASEQGQQLLSAVDYMTITSRIGDFYAHSGWYFPVHPSFHRHAMEHLTLHQPFDPREAARLVGPESRHWPWIVEGLLASPSIESRSLVVREGTRCMEEGLWHAAVSTLLPMIEGIASDRSGVLEGKRVGRRIDDILNSTDGALEAISAVPALEVVDAEIFERRDFNQVQIADEALNRHLVLHGRPVQFGTEINAVRTLMLLVALVEIIDGALLFRATSIPPDGGSLLDDYGPLAPLRQAAA